MTVESLSDLIVYMLIGSAVFWLVCSAFIAPALCPSSDYLGQRGLIN